jgi:hypothetical protein
MRARRSESEINSPMPETISPGLKEPVEKCC